MKFTYIAIVLSALLIAGCSKSEKPATTSAYPKEAAAVTSDPAYKLAFKSEQSGISYYLRRLNADEVAKMPPAAVIRGEAASLLMVPIKDNQIVEAQTSD